VVELIRTNEPVLLSWLTAALAAEGIETVVLDTHASIVEGSISAIPRRLMVADEDLFRARQIVAEAERLAADDATS
jgi:hypothetical protein